MSLEIHVGFVTVLKVVLHFGGRGFESRAFDLGLGERGNDISTTHPEASKILPNIQMMPAKARAYTYLYARIYILHIQIHVYLHMYVYVYGYVDV